MVDKNLNLLEEQFRANYPFSDIVISFPMQKKSPSLKFAAYLTSLKDSYQQTWQEDGDAYGRMDPMISYKNTSRNINVSFSIPTSNLDDAKNKMEQMRTLVKNLYPGYIKSDTQYIINSPPLLRVKFIILFATQIIQKKDFLLS
jgi:hypothetical protein